MYKRLTIEMIEASHEIQAWLRPFSIPQRSTAIALLTQLRFVSRDAYSEWLKTTLSRIPCDVCGLYAVRKFNKIVKCLWNKQGRTLPRPATSMGSEDLVHSVISGMLKTDPTRYLDHPSIPLMKRSKCFHAVLIDDSTGSGDRLCSYLTRLFNNKTVMSRWNFGLVKLHIVTYARSFESEELVLQAIPGSDHGLRVYPKANKVSFHGHWAYPVSELNSRWGANSKAIQDLCESIKAVPKDRRQGYGGTMSNVIFYHSVPNNIPGMLFFQNRKWNALFPKRSLPEWLPKLLEGTVSQEAVPGKTRISETLIRLLLCVKSGRRNEVSLSRSMAFDTTVIRELLVRARVAGVINQNNRLTRAGLQAIWDNTDSSTAKSFDFSLYIPSKWCAGRATIQPSGLDGETRWERTESTSGSPRVDGGVGQTPLERTDAMTALPSLDVTTQNPAAAWEGGDAYGPLA